MSELSNTAWYVVHTKPRQETRALENLENQGFKCFLPMMQVQKLRNQRVQTVTEPMFSRYLFIQLNDETQNWGPIRSTLGVSKLVSFGHQPAKVPSEFVEFLQEAPSETLERMFSPGDNVLVWSPTGRCVDWKASTWRTMARLGPLCWSICWGSPKNCAWQ